MQVRVLVPVPVQAPAPMVPQQKLHRHPLHHLHHHHHHHHHQLPHLPRITTVERRAVEQQATTERTIVFTTMSKMN